EKITIEDPKLLRLAEVWRFFGALFTICEEEEDMIGFHPGKPARQPGFADPLRPEVRMKVVDGLDQPSGPRGSSAISGGSSSSSSGLQGGTASQGNSIACERVGLQWLEDNAGLVRTCMAPLADQVRSALDLVGEGLEGGGVTLSDVLLDNPGNPCWALHCMLANLQATARWSFPVPRLPQRRWNSFFAKRKTMATIHMV
ncbi:unnamed protein product, partial [Polarella glacialis]